MKWKWSFLCLDELNSFISGLVDLEHSENGSTTILPVPPGHYEDYDLQPNGKVKHKNTVRFHDVGDKPQYKTHVTIGK